MGSTRNPEDISNVVCCFASEVSHRVTGSQLEVDADAMFKRTS